MSPLPDLKRSANWRWLPNALTLARLGLTLPVYLFAVQDKWALGCLCIALALSTDFLDGLAAKKLHAESVIGGYVDSVVDFLLATAGVMGLIIGARMLPGWIVLIAAPVCLFIGYAKFIAPKGSRLHTMFPILSLPLLFATWTFMFWGYLTQAFGWSWLYIPATGIILLLTAIMKKHRLRYWFGWLLGNRI